MIGINIWIAGKKYEVRLDCGWYRGNEFALFKLSLFEKGEVCFILVGIQIAKFEFDLFLEKCN